MRRHSEPLTPSALRDVGSVLELSSPRRGTDLPPKQNSTSAPSNFPFYGLHLINNEKFHYRNPFFLQIMFLTLYFLIQFLFSRLSLMTRSGHWKGAETKGQSVTRVWARTREQPAGWGIPPRPGQHSPSAAQQRSSGLQLSGLESPWNVVKFWSHFFSG